MENAQLKSSRFSQRSVERQRRRGRNAENLKGGEPEKCIKSKKKRQSMPREIAKGRETEKTKESKNQGERKRRIKKGAR